MKKFNHHIHLFLVALSMFSHATLIAQTEFTVNGQLLNEQKEPVMFANVALLSCTDSNIVAGTISDEKGQFNLKHNNRGDYCLSVRFIGFVPFEKKITLSHKAQLEMAPITLKLNRTTLDEVVVVEDRLKAKQEVNKTTYFVNTAMRSTANTGTDIIQKVPGVQVDLLQNISLNGSRNIIILVNGIERDAAYLAQINPDKIDRIEVKETPGAQYDADVSGVLNVVLKKNMDKGVSGHVYVNVPTDKNEVFSFPSAKLTYTTNKLTLFSSYNGGFSYFDIKTVDKRNIFQGSNLIEITKKEHLFQENWSHKQHFGMDYFFNENNQLNVYGFISLFSNEQSGNFAISKIEDSAVDQSLQYLRNDNDINASVYSSVFYKHIINEKTAVSFDANYYMLQSKTKLHLNEINTDNSQISESQPYNNLLKARLNFQFSLNDYITINTGIEQNTSRSGDKLMSNFSYTESTTTTYLSAKGTKNKLQTNLGARTEYWQYFSNIGNKKQLMILPTLHIKYGFANSKNLHFSYKRGIVRPSVFQLNPNVQTIDIYANQKGNKDLRPIINHNIKLNYTLSFGDSFLNTGVFYTFNKDVFEIMTTTNEGSVLEKELQNLGNITHYGLNASGSFKVGKNITINPHLRLFSVKTRANKIADSHNVENKKAINFESSLSAMYLMKHNFSLSFSMQYKSQQTQLQNDYREDPLYFVALEKTFFKKLKVGITSAIPFKRTFTYQGYDIAGTNFTQNTEDNIQMSVFPIWLKLKYTFSAGKKAKRIDRDNSFKENIPHKGF